MTQTLNPRDTGDIRLGATRDLTYLLRPPVRRPDATGEQPVYRPATIADVDVPLDELTRLSLGETLVLPVDAEPAPERAAVPTVYAGPQQGRPRQYRGRYRPPVSPWLSGVLSAAYGMLGGVLVLLVAVALAGDGR